MERKITLELNPGIYYNIISHIVQSITDIAVILEDYSSKLNKGESMDYIHFDGMFEKYERLRSLLWALDCEILVPPLSEEVRCCFHTRSSRNRDSD